jgi:hypothetical protein
MTFLLRDRASTFLHASDTPSRSHARRPLGPRRDPYSTVAHARRRIHEHDEDQAAPAHHGPRRSHGGPSLARRHAARHASAESVRSSLCRRRWRLPIRVFPQEGLRDRRWSRRLEEEVHPVRCQKSAAGSRMRGRPGPVGPELWCES